jgi:hypothetical protein
VAVNKRWEDYGELCMYGQRENLCVICDSLQNKGSFLCAECDLKYEEATRSPEWESIEDNEDAFTDWCNLMTLDTGMVFGPDDPRIPCSMCGGMAMNDYLCRRLSWSWLKNLSVNSPKKP